MDPTLSDAIGIWLLVVYLTAPPHHRQLALIAAWER